VLMDQAERSRASRRSDTGRWLVSRSDTGIRANSPTTPSDWGQAPTGRECGRR
jgi:hypothetical protein